jgi:hypothetical protein
MEVIDELRASASGEESHTHWSEGSVFDTRTDVIAHRKFLALSGLNSDRATLIQPLLT